MAKKRMRITLVPQDQSVDPSNAALHNTGKKVEDAAAEQGLTAESKTEQFGQGSGDTGQEWSTAEDDRRLTGNVERRVSPVLDEIVGAAGDAAKATRIAAGQIGNLLETVNRESEIAKQNLLAKAFQCLIETKCKTDSYGASTAAFFYENQRDIKVGVVIVAVSKLTGS